MIAYLDTSALVKLYVSEAGTRALRRYAYKCDALATSVVAYAETRAAFARLLRSGRTKAREHARRLRSLNGDWDDYVRVELTPDLARDAGDVAEVHALRGFDSIHLASALWLKERAPSGLVFAAYDGRLLAAAAQAGMDCYPQRQRNARR